MNTVTLSRHKYRELKGKAAKFDRIVETAAGEFFAPPPVRSIKKIMSEFKGTRLYNRRFLESLRRGLSRSAYFQPYQ